MNNMTDRVNKKSQLYTNTFTIDDAELFSGVEAGDDQLWGARSEVDIFTLSGP